MATNIEWASHKNEDGTITKGETWNPTVGCTEVSPGCLNCYAAKMAYRIVHMKNKAAQDYAGTVKKLQNGKVVWTGQVNILTDRLLQPARNKKPTTYFVDSMSDLFHESIPFAYIDKVFAVMMLCPQHTFQVLTKRTERMLEYCKSRQDMEQITEAAEILVLENPDLFYEQEKYKDEQGTITLLTEKLLKHLSDFGWYSGLTYVSWGEEGEYDKDYEFFYEGNFPAKHIWLGTSIEDQKAADQRGAPLYEIHRLGWVTWVSNEPMIGPINWEEPFYFGFLDWLVTGSESGKAARPMQSQWAVGSKDFCEKNKVAWFFKQWGTYYTTWQQFGKEEPVFKYYESYLQFTQKLWVNKGDALISIDGRLCKKGLDMQECGYPVAIMQKMGKHKAGRLLDGKLHDAYPIIGRDSKIAK